MTRSLLRALPWLSLLAACGEEPVEPGAVTIQLQRGGDLTFTAANNADNYTITLTQGSLNLVGANLADLTGDETAVLQGEQRLDLLSPDPLTLGIAEVFPADFAEILLFPGDATAGDFAGLSLQLDATVTLTNGTDASGALALSLGPGLLAQRIPVAFSLPAGGAFTASLSFSPEILFSGVDFDGLADSGSFSLRAGTGDPAIEAALSAIEINLFRSFSFLEAQ